MSVIFSTAIFFTSLANHPEVFSNNFISVEHSFIEKPKDLDFTIN